MNLVKTVEFEVTTAEFCALTEQLGVDEMCDILLNFKRYRPHQSKMIFERIVSDFKEETSELISKFVKSEPKYISYIDANKVIDDFTDYIDINY